MNITNRQRLPVGRLSASSILQYIENKIDGKKFGSLTATFAIHAETAPQAFVPTVEVGGVDEADAVDDAGAVVDADTLVVGADALVDVTLLELAGVVDAAAEPSPRALLAAWSKRLFW